MLQTFILGLLLGWGAAIPIGPVNLEIMRRHLSYGWSAGVTLGLGACTADLCYILILSLGLLSVFKYPLVLASFGMVGALILAWFAYGAFRLSVSPHLASMGAKKSAGRSFLEGLGMTLISPFTILFWASVSAQVAGFATQQHSILIAASGVIVGTLSWVIGFNSVLHITKHKITLGMRKLLNISAGLVLSAFAIYGFMHGANLVRHTLMLG